MLLNRNNIVNLFALLIILICLKLMDFNQGMSAYWVGPYLSAAANFDFTSFSMMVDFNDIKQFSLLSKDLQFSYSFSSSSSTIEYNYLAKGFLFILLFAKQVFFFLGDLEAVQYLQYFVHVFIVLSILKLLDAKYKKVLFFIL